MVKSKIDIDKNIKLKNCLLKIDVEGFEYNVLQGSENKMDEIKYKTCW